MKTKKLTKDEARMKLRRLGVPISKNFFTLTPAQVDRLIEVADEMKYRKPKNASGSRGRYFYAYLNSKRGED